MFQERTLKYFELMIAFACWLLAGFWVKNHWLRVNFHMNPCWLLSAAPAFSLIHLGDLAFSQQFACHQKSSDVSVVVSAEKLDKTDVRSRANRRNNKEYEILLRSVEIHAPASVINAVGKQQKQNPNSRYEKIGNDAFPPMRIPGKSSKTLMIELAYDASNIGKYIQASKLAA